MARPKLKVMSLTEAAAERIKTLMTNPANPIKGLRIGVKNGGCAGMEYTIESVETPNPHDELVEDKGAVIYVDQKAVLFLLGAEMDYKTGTLSSTFVFNNPNQTGACGCGESVSLTPAVSPAN
ncbi:MAG: Fe-S cluster assembly scaffold SufA [Pseudomonadota bacterium]